MTADLQNNAVQRIEIGEIDDHLLAPFAAQLQRHLGSQ